jgi:hypothetical protein
MWLRGWGSKQMQPDGDKKKGEINAEINFSWIQFFILENLQINSTY